MDYKKLAEDSLSGCDENCADCGYAGDSEFECTIVQLAATAITDLLARAEAAEAEAEHWKSAHHQAALNFQQENRECNKALSELKDAEARAENAERERDAAIKDLYIAEDCETCKSTECVPRGGNGKCRFKWRGQKEE